MSSEEGWSLAFFDAPAEVVLPWIAGAFVEADRAFRSGAPLRRWITPAPRLRRGVALDEVRGGHVAPLRFGPAVGAGRVTLVEAREGEAPVALERIATEAGVDFYRMAWRPDLMALMVTLGARPGRPRHLTVWREAGRWHRRETGRPLPFEEPGAFGGPGAGAPFTDAVLRRYLGKIAPGLEPGAGILAEAAMVIGLGRSGARLGRIATGVALAGGKLGLAASGP